MLISIALIFLVGLFLGAVFERFRLPKFIGMILAGVVLGPYALNLIDNSILSNSADIRQIALVIILTRAGLSLNINDLKKLGRPAVLMCFVPACFEIAGIAILAPIFTKVTLVQALIMGCVIAAVSPAVIIPRMIKLSSQGYGVQKSIPQLILAGASVDDVFVIVLFTSFTSLELSGEFSVLSLVKVPVSIILGIGLGIVVGYLLNIFFKKTALRNTIKVIILLSFSFVMLEIEEILKNIVPVSALIGIMVVGLFIYQKNNNLSKQLSEKYNKMWVVGEIMLFVLVGTLLDIRYLVHGGIGLVVIILGALVFRVLGVFICLLKTNLSMKERAFCMGAYTPKATVQAAIGAVPLSMGITGGDIILTISILSIIITAPMGAIFIDKTYKKLLQKGIDKG